MKTLRSQLANHDVNIDHSLVELSAGEIDAVSGGIEGSQDELADVRFFGKVVIVIRF